MTETRNEIHECGDDLKVLFVGLGAVGQRHLHNLRALLGNKVEVMAWRTGKNNHVHFDHSLEQKTGALEKRYGLNVVPSLEEALNQKPQIVFIANPSSLHVPVALAAAEAGCHLFIEKPLSNSTMGLDELQAIVQKKSLHVMVGFQFRFNPGLRAVKQLIDDGAIGKVVSCQVHWGEYLPGWHPWEDYRKSYSAQEDLGGGVILTLCHPFDYLRWLIGEIQSVSAISGLVGGLELEVEDTANINVEFQSGVIGTVHLDYVQRPPSHWIQITGQTGTIKWDNADGTVTYYQADEQKWHAIPSPPGFERNNMFLDEVQHFFDCLYKNEEPVVSLNDGIRALEIALAAKESGVQRKVIEVSSEYVFKNV
ncbi:Gfo/Idh/MocA family oxidoreductase [Candidatus Nitronereus thalassa]|uniref:Gfo/Idh/MocA family oxidoreductase n=1 Tax=Candidatus Nitronereus thalassa TaxID=3020898 RepID=A0ABU3K5A4_9BACT|nr:Gfo/Idh/MocA family oxidoreductase [Candidatus Nitronereus thalassa]MDT7041542.1 Gfo/Idh/MocA family oxidoreductase [Candidatus Nitronereus thalassa]